MSDGGGVLLEKRIEEGMKEKRREVREDRIKRRRNNKSKEGRGREGALVKKKWKKNGMGGENGEDERK